jgi:hypothetical protein
MGTHWRSLTDRETLGAWDLVDKAGKPKDYTLEIVKVAGGVVKSMEKPKGEKRPYVWFRGADKPMVMNATNSKAFSAMSGSPEIESWIGMKVTLYQTQVKAKGGELVPGIRVRPMKAKGDAEIMGAGQPVDPVMREQQDKAFDRGDNPDDH